MTGHASRDALLKALLNLLGDKSSESDRVACLKSIEEDVDLDFVNGLTQWIKSQSDGDNPFKVGKIMSSMSYWMALEFAFNSTKAEHVCIMSQIYADYMHNVAHMVFEEDVAPKLKSKK